MFALFKKEVSGFFSSLTGYVVVVVFLLITGAFMWIIPGQTNVIETGYASLDPLFIIAPWVFMFLVPAVSMRQFSDEKRLGTIELLFTRPISDMSIVWAKYLSALTIVLLALLPTLIYYYAVYQLGSPAGNLDVGGTWGSYIGLVFLAAVYTSIGIWCSALTDNQIVAFVLSMLLSFVFYYGFDAFSAMIGSGKIELVVQQLSIDRHYQSISRGVIDTRDLIYFLSVIAFFLLLTKVKLQSRKWA